MGNCEPLLSAVFKAPIRPRATLLFRGIVIRTKKNGVRVELMRFSFQSTTWENINSTLTPFFANVYVNVKQHAGQSVAYNEEESVR